VTQPMMMPRVFKTTDYKSNRIPPKKEIARIAGVTDHIMGEIELGAMTKVAAHALMAGHDEFEGVVLKGLLHFDGVWKRERGGTPKSMREYLQWHRDRRAKAERAEAIKRADAERAAREVEERKAKRAAAAERVSQLSAAQAEAEREAVLDRWRRRKEAAGLPRQERDRLAAKRCEQRALAAVMADGLLGVVCAHLGVDRGAVIVTTNRKPATVRARRVFLCIARDTTYCGVAPSFPVLSRLLCASSHTGVVEAHFAARHTLEVRNDVARVCASLGIAAPEYVKEQPCASP